MAADFLDITIVFIIAITVAVLGAAASKRKDSRYRSGRSHHWVKTKNPAAPAATREIEEDWGKKASG
jgi:hypothetical protein